MKHIGLFEGIGGFSLAARWMGWETVAWCEWDEFCKKVLKHHFPESEQHGDIRKTDFTGYAGQIDILTGGFPCQPYSSAGKRLGKEDDRHLWPDMLRAIREIQPRWVVGENVRGLTNWNGGVVFDEVQADLENESYKVTPYLLPACAVNGPHRRDRIWFVAYSQKNSHNNGTRNAGSFAQKISCERPNESVVTSNLHKERLQRGAEFGGIGGIGQNSKKQPTGCVRPNWDKFPTKSPVCSGNDGVPGGLAGITFSEHRKNSIGAYGNAIVPQVAYLIFKAIQQFEQLSAPTPQP